MLPNIFEMLMVFICKIRPAYKISNVSKGTLSHREIGIKGSHTCKRYHHIIILVDGEKVPHP